MGMTHVVEFTCDLCNAKIKKPSSQELPSGWVLVHRPNTFGPGGTPRYVCTGCVGQITKETKKQ